MDAPKPDHDGFRRFLQCAVAVLGPPVGFAIGALLASFVFDLVQESRGYRGTLGEAIGWGMTGALPGLVMGAVLGYLLSRKIASGS